MKLTAQTITKLPRNAACIGVRSLAWESFYFSLCKHTHWQTVTQTQTRTCFPLLIHRPNNRILPIP